MPKKQTSSLFLNSIASIFGRFTGLATQFVMAWFLTPADYGLYAIALGITTFTTMMRGGGTGVVFQTMKMSEFATIGGGLLRMAIGCGILGTLFTLAMVLPAPYLYPNDNTGGLGWLLFWSAVGFLVFNITTYPRAKVLSRLKFKHIAAMDIASSIVKLASAYYFASNDYGALSFVLSQFLGNVILFVWNTAVAGMEREDFKASPHWIAETYAIMKLPFVMALMTSLGGQTDLFVASFFMPFNALGVYLFTNQMAVQPVQLLTGTLQSVLSPYAARVRGDHEQENISVRTTFLTGVIFVPLIIMGVAAVYPSMAHCLFAEKWDASIVPVQFTCAFLIYPTVQSLLEAPLMGARRWNLVLELFTGRMVAKIAGALLGVGVLTASKWVAPIPEASYALTMVLGVGITTTILSLVQIRKISRQIQLSDSTFRFEIYSTTIYSILAAIATSSLSTGFIQLIGFSSASIRTQGLFECIFCAITYGGTAIALMRFGYVEQLQALLKLFPSHSRKFILKMLVLNEPESPNQPLG